MMSRGSRTACQAQNVHSVHDGCVHSVHEGVHLVYERCVHSVHEVCTPSA